MCVFSRLPTCQHFILLLGGKTYFEEPVALNKTNKKYFYFIDIVNESKKLVMKLRSM